VIKTIKNRIEHLEKRFTAARSPVDIPLRLPEPHEMQQRVIDEARRFNVACLGRRSGKTVLGTRLAIDIARQGKPVAWCSPTYKMLLEVWRNLRHTLHDYATRISDADKRIDLHGGGCIEMWSLERPDALRGRKYARVIIDEAAMVRGLQDAWQQIIRPTLADMQGDVFFFSTPKGVNYFWQLYQDAQDKPDWASWQMSSHCNPHLPSTEIDAIKEELPERVYEQEVLARALEDGAFFTGIQDCVYYDLPEHAAPYVAGIDVGRTDDYTVVVVMDAKQKTVVHTERFTGIGFAAQAERIKDIYTEWAPDVVMVEINSFGRALYEMLAHAIPVQPFSTTNQSKQHIIDMLAIALEKQAISIPDDKVLIGELAQYTQEQLPGGLVRFGAPSGQHDDMVMALALANAVAGSYE
jgi:phage FluMu gp28-like protein